MARYIDAEILLEELEYKIKRDNENGMVTIDHDFITLVNDAPTEEVAKVVICKNCKHSQEQDKVFGITDYKCSKHKISCLSPYDFCSYGKRRDT